MSSLAVIILITGAIGHVVLWCAVVNRVHALGIRRRWVDALTIFTGLALVVLPLIVGSAVFNFGNAWLATQLSILPRLAWGYVGLCNVVLGFSIIQRWFWFRHPER